MKSVVCIAVLLLLAGSASAQTRRTSPSPSPKVSPSPSPKVSPSPALDGAPAETDATMEPMGDNATVPATTGSARPRAAGAGGAANIPDKRIKALYDSPEAAAKRIPELRELSKLISASPAVTKLLQDKNLVATIFAPNNAAVTGALEYVSTNFPNMTTAELGEMGIIDGLLQYHVTAGNAALTSDRLRNNMKLTMLNQEPVTIIKKAAAGARHLLQAEESISVRSNTNQTVPVVDGAYQGGKAVIHVIDGVLIPASLAANYSMTDIPGASNDTMEEPAAAGADNATALEPTATGTRAGAADTTAPGPSPAPKPKSSAGAAVASLLAVPTLLAVLML